MDEQFLYYIWSNKLIEGKPTTTDGDDIEIVLTGYRNTDSGPDFKEAKIKIGDTLWAGNIEIHVKTSDWNRHRHQHDKAYNNVILHVVYEHDTKVNNIPVVELKKHINDKLIDSVSRFIDNKQDMACGNSLRDTQHFTWISWLDNIIMERLHQKYLNISKILDNNTYDWDDAFYRLLLHYMGMKVNNDAFALLTNILPYKVLRKHADNLLQIEAMLFGCAGMLNNTQTDEYCTLLRREFAIMQAKFDLKVMPTVLWKYMRMRPGNFPTIRIAQAAQIIHLNGDIFSQMLNCRDTNEMRKLLSVGTSPYWETHFRFMIPSRRSTKHLGDTTANTIIINAVAPLLFAYGKRHELDNISERAISILEETAAEDNKVTRRFATYGIAPQNALQSQAMLTLYENYCKRHRCLECRIGNILINNNSTTVKKNLP